MICIWFSKLMVKRMMGTYYWNKFFVFSDFVKPYSEHLKNSYRYLPIFNIQNSLINNFENFRTYAIESNNKSSYGSKKTSDGGQCFENASAWNIVTLFVK